MKSKEELKKLFENGDKPTQEDFWEWQDSYWHKNEKLSVENIDYDFFQKKDLTDKALNVTSQEFLDEGIATQEDFNIDTREKLNSKLNKPYAEGTIQQYSKFLGLDNNGNTVALPTEDLEKNLANSSLTSTAGSGLTLGADWAVETLGHQYSISGLSDVSADQEFNTFISQNASGKLGKTNGIQPFLNLPNSLSEQEKTKWKTAMNGGWTTNTMSVATITPPVVDKQDKNYWVTLRGANLNLNPASFSVDLMANDGTTLIANIPGSQVQLYTTGIDLTFYYNYKDLPLGNYKIRLWNGVAYYTTSFTLNVVALLNKVDLNNIVWSRKIYNNAISERITESGTSVNYSSDNSVKAIADDSSFVAARKTNELIGADENFYMVVEISGKTNTQVNSSGNMSHFVGLVNSNVTVDLLNQTVINFRSVQSYYFPMAKFYPDNSASFLETIDSTYGLTVIFIRQSGNWSVIIIHNDKTLLHTKTGYTGGISFGMYNQNTKVSTGISANIVELYKF